MTGGARPDPARVAALFDEVVDLDPDEARRRLDGACRDAPAVRAAVERLVAHDRAARDGFLQPDAALAAAALDERAALAATPALPGEVPVGSAKLGRFFVLHKLGEGGMGVVYVGYDEALDRRVALKLLRRGPEARAWLLREGQALGRLSSPHVVGVHEVGEHDGRVFLAMELVRGSSLTAWLAAGTRPFDEVLAMLVQAGRGLAAAHAAGLVHRDFKPDNVLVGEDGRARVADFGIAALAAERAGAAIREAASERAPGASPSVLESPLTGAAALVGTPAFMAPELFRGRRATAASDQWSFCVTLYRAAYGAAPFPEDDLAALMRAVTEGEPAAPPPGARAPAWLWPVIRRGLAGDPAARFPSMEALLAALEAHLPRDPDLDPAVVRAERRIMAGVVFLLASGIAGTVLSRGSAYLPGQRWAPVRIALFIVFVLGAAAALLRRRLAKNLYGRRVAGLMLVVAVGMLAHRLAAVRLGTPVGAVIVDDLIMLAALFTVAGLTMERVFLRLAALCLGGAAVALCDPSLTVPCFAAVSLGNALQLLARWGRRSQ